MEVMTATIVQKEKKGLFCKSIFQHGVTAHAGDEIFYLKPRQGGRRSDLLVYVMLKKKKISRRVIPIRKETRKL